MKLTRLILISCIAIVGAQVNLFASDNSPKKYALAAFFRADNVHFNEMAGNYLTYRNLCQLSSTSQAFNHMRKIHHMPTTPDAWVAYFYETLNKLPVKKGLAIDSQAAEKAVWQVLMHKLSCSDRPLTHMASILRGYFDDVTIPEGLRFPKKEIGVGISRYSHYKFLPLRFKELPLLNKYRMELKKKVELAKAAKPNNSAELTHSIDEQALADMENQMRPIVQELTGGLRAFQPYVLPWLTSHYLFGGDHCPDFPFLLHQIPDVPAWESEEFAWLIDHTNAQTYRRQLVADHAAIALLLDVHAGLIPSADGLGKIEDVILGAPWVDVKQNSWEYNQEGIALFKQQIGIYKHFLEKKKNKLYNRSNEELCGGNQATIANFKQYLQSQIRCFKQELEKPENATIKIVLLEQLIQCYEAWYAHEVHWGDALDECAKYYSIASAYRKASKYAKGENEKRTYIAQAYDYIKRCIKESEYCGAIRVRPLHQAGLICARYASLYKHEGMRLRASTYFEQVLSNFPSFSDYADAANARWNIAIKSNDLEDFKRNCIIAINHRAKAAHELAKLTAEDLTTEVDYLKKEWSGLSKCIRQAQRKNVFSIAGKFILMCKTYMELIADRLAQLEGQKPAEKKDEQ